MRSQIPFDMRLQSYWDREPKNTQAHPGRNESLEGKTIATDEEMPQSECTHEIFNACVPFHDYEGAVLEKGRRLFVDAS